MTDKLIYLLGSEHRDVVIIGFLIFFMGLMYFGLSSISKQYEKEIAIEKNGVNCKGKINKIIRHTRLSTKYVHNVSFNYKDETIDKRIEGTFTWALGDEGDEIDIIYSPDLNAVTAKKVDYYLIYRKEYVLYLVFFILGLLCFFMLLYAI